MKAIFIDIDNTLLDFDAYVRESMRAGFARFGLRPYEPWMYDIFVRENDKLWQAIERSELTFARLHPLALGAVAGVAAFAGPNRVMRWVGVVLPAILRMRRG